jgi:hypothetical protein
LRPSTQKELIKAKKRPLLYTYRNTFGTSARVATSSAVLISNFKEICISSDINYTPAAAFFCCYFFLSVSLERRPRLIFKIKMGLCLRIVFARRAAKK